VIRSLGHSPESVFSAADVDPALYTHPENRIAVLDLGRLFACGARVTGRADIALLVVSSFQPQGLGLVGEIAAEGPDVRTALKNLVRLLPYNTLAGYPVLSTSENMAVMKYELRDSDFPGSEFILEGATGIILRFMQWLLGHRWRPDEVHLCRRAPSDPRPFHTFFGIPVRFSATEDAILFTADWLDRPVLREERRQKARRVEIAAAPYSELVRRQTARRLGFAPLGAQQIASDLGISRRQLFRHLKAEGATFQMLIDEFRFARARHLLTAGDAPLTQIAFALGFPEQSAFSRAFARWCGEAPSRWRRPEVSEAAGPDGRAS
jgi:AraC-like DNA-binding protein